MVAAVLPVPLHPAADSIVMPEVAYLAIQNGRVEFTLARNGAANATVYEVAMAIFRANGVDPLLNHRSSSTGNWACYSALFA